MRTRKVVAEIGVAKNLQPETPHFQARYDSLDTHGLDPGSWKEWENGRMGQVVNASTMANLYESYIPQKHQSDEKALPSRSPQDLLAIIKSIIPSIISGPAYSTWIDPLQAVGYAKNRLVLAATSDFNREQILKRYRKDLENLVAELTDGALVGVEVVVDESLVVEIPAAPEPEVIPVKLIDRRNQWGMRQNPTDNPDVDALLRKHGDMRRIFIECGLFKAAFKQRQQNGWGMDFPALMALGKQHGLERILWGMLYVMQEVKKDPSITNPAGVLTAAVRNGKEPDSMAAIKAYL
jgi:DnaA N-terminal domain